jgi:small subunit ribosomal protein S18
MIKSKQCFFCSQNAQIIDFREIETLKRFVSSQGKIIDPRHTGLCAKHQRQIARAIKRARVMGLLSFTGR